MTSSSQAPGVHMRSMNNGMYAPVVHQTNFFHPTFHGMFKRSTQSFGICGWKFPVTIQDVTQLFSTRDHQGVHTYPGHSYNMAARAMTTPWTHETTAVPLLLPSSSALESQWEEIIEWQGSHPVQFYKVAVSLLLLLCVRSRSTY